MSYNLPANAGLLLGLGNKMHVGLVELGQTLGLTQITPAAGEAPAVKGFTHRSENGNGHAARA